MELFGAEKSEVEASLQVQVSRTACQWQGQVFARDRAFSSVDKKAHTRNKNGVFRKLTPITSKTHSTPPRKRNKTHTPQKSLQNVTPQAQKYCKLHAFLILGGSTSCKFPARQPGWANNNNNKAIAMIRPAWKFWGAFGPQRVRGDFWDLGGLRHHHPPPHPDSPAPKKSMQLHPGMVIIHNHHPPPPPHPHRHGSAREV